MGLINMNRHYIGKLVHVVVDIQAGNSHPEFPKTIYSMNYGHIPGTISGDGEELDAYILGIKIPLEEYDGRVIAIIHRTNDDDDKLIVVEDGKSYSDDEIRKQTDFIEKYFESIILR